MVKKVIMVLKIGQNPAPQRNKVITNAIFYLAWYYFKIHDNSRGEKSHLLLQDLRISFPKAITIIQSTKNTYRIFRLQFASTVYSFTLIFLNGISWQIYIERLLWL